MILISFLVLNSVIAFLLAISAERVKKVTRKELDMIKLLINEQTKRYANS